MSVVATGCRGPSDNTHSPCRHSTCRCSFLFGETLLQLCGLVISLPFEAAGKRQVVAVFMCPESQYAEARRSYICRGDTVTNILNDDEVGGYLRRPGARPLCVVYDLAGKLMSTGGEHGADAQSVQRKNTSLEHENGEESAADDRALRRRAELDRHSEPRPGKRGRLTRSSSSEPSSPESSHESSSSDGDPAFPYSTWARFQRRFEWIADLQLGDPDLDVKRAMCHVDMFLKRQPCHDEARRCYAALQAMLSRSSD